MAGAGGGDDSISMQEHGDVRMCTETHLSLDRSLSLVEINVTTQPGTTLLAPGATHVDAIGHQQFDDLPAFDT